MLFLKVNVEGKEKSTNKEFQHEGLSNTIFRY